MALRWEKGQWGLQQGRRREGKMIKIRVNVKVQCFQDYSVCYAVCIPVCLLISAFFTLSMSLILFMFNPYLQGSSYNLIFVGVSKITNHQGQT